MKTISLRKWQYEALEKIKPLSHPLIVATPGSGKTTFAIVSSLFYLKEYVEGKIIIVVPTKHLKKQWAESAGKFGVKMHDDWVAPQKIPDDYHGIILTYAQLGSSWGAISRIVKKNKSMIILDEIHHAGEDLTWGDGVTKAFNNAVKVLSLSGTPYRSDNNKIPFIKYIEEFGGFTSVNDYVYSYQDALKDGVVRQISFEIFDGTVQGEETKQISEMTKNDTSMLRAAYQPNSNWGDQILRKAHSHLQEIRKSDPQAGGIVFCLDQEHAIKVQKALTKISGKKPAIAISSNPEASNIISKFANSDSLWIISVRMISEGIDIPRLKTGVYLSSVTTDLFFTQAIGRILRRTSTPLQEATLFMPAYGPLTGKIKNFQRTKNHVIEDKDEENKEKEERKESLDLDIFNPTEIQYISLFDEEPEIMSVKTEIQPEEFIEIEIPIETDSIFDASFRKTTENQTKEYAKIIAKQNGTTMNKVLTSIDNRLRIESVETCSDEMLAKRLDMLKEQMKKQKSNNSGVINKKNMHKLYLQQLKEQDSIKSE